MASDTAQRVYAAIAADLREFGYPDTTPEMIQEVHTAYQEGKRGRSLPHGILGMFAEDMLTKATERGLLRGTA